MVDFKAVQEKWQKAWEDNALFRTVEDSEKKKYYVLEMYPYPSGSGLHMGHASNYTKGDVYARYKRMQGFNVLYPMGYDSFGLPAENAAIKNNSHPKIYTEKAIANFQKQQKSLGLSYDWDRSIMSHDSSYYRWDQWIFLKLYEKGLVYKKKGSVNWCPECNTVLANEQVHDGKCWRHTDTTVEVKELEQWFIRITEYAEQLLDDLQKLDAWSDEIKTMQKNWIGKSKGTLIEFQIEDENKKIQVYTTRPDTFFGITFLVYAPEHPEVAELVKGTEYESKVKEFVKKVVQEDRFKRTAEDYEKEGMFIGKYAINPITKEKIPIYIANFVLYEYGTGAIIAVPAHDERDFRFAKKYDIPIKVVINPPSYDLNAEKMSRSYMGDGNLVNSKHFDGMNNKEAIPEITRYFEKHDCGKAAVQYKLRDWLISRQRFWGCPIPIVYCEKCGAVPVPEKQLPVRLPESIVLGSGKGNPLEACEEFLKTTCPECNAEARRETDTMDTFMDSSWYYLRYCDPENNEKPFDPEKAKYWMPIDLYIGGKEHATMHLIYFRFMTKFLRDIGMLSIDEPVNRLFNQGMLHKEGVVMSKSKGNVVLPEEVSDKHGIDTGRLFLLFVAGPEKDIEWDDKGVEGVHRFMKRFWNLISDNANGIADEKEESKINKLIKKVTGYVENIEYNKAVIELMQTTNYFVERGGVSKETAKKLLLLMGPMTPHICEELWHSLGEEGFISTARWPSYDENKINEELEAEDDFVQQVREDIIHLNKLLKFKPEKMTIVLSPEWKHEFYIKLKQALEDTREMKALIEQTRMQGHEKEIAKIIQSCLKDPGKIPEQVLGKEAESKSLEENRKGLEKEFNIRIEIVEEHEKKQGRPGKPALLAE